MKAAPRWWRVGILGVAIAPLAGCGIVPVPRFLEPVLGASESYSDIRLCIVDLSAPRGLRVVDAQRADGSGDLFLREEGGRRRLPTSAKGGYAAGEAWYRDEEPIRQYGNRYVKYGPQRVVPASALTRGAEHRGIPVFLDREDITRPSALYVPVEPGCVFQPYVDASQAAAG